MGGALKQRQKYGKSAGFNDFKEFSYGTLMDFDVILLFPKHIST